MTRGGGVIGAVVLAWIVSLGAAAASVDDELAAAESLYRARGAAEALPEFERLAAMLRDSGDARRYAIALGMVGECYWRIGEFDRADAVLNDALTRKRAAGDRQQEAKTINVLGLLAWQRGRFAEATVHFEQAAAIGRELGDRKLEGAALNNVSLVGDELGDYHASLERYTKVLELFREIGFERGEGDVLGNIGGVNLLLGRYSEAEGWYAKALALSTKLESSTSLSQDHGNLAMSLAGQGNLVDAIAHFDAAISLAKSSGMSRDEAYWQRAKADALADRGDFDDALALYRSATATYARIGADAERAEALQALGSVYLALGDATAAERTFREALRRARSTGLARVVTSSLLALGDIAVRRERTDEAIALYEQAVGRAREAGEMAAWSEGLLRLASVLRASDTENEAMAAATQALDIARETGARITEVEALIAEADLHRDAKRYPQARGRFDEALGLAQSIGAPDLLWRAHHGRGRTMEEAGDLESAIADLEAAIRVIESVRGRLGEQRYRTGYAQDKYGIYVDLVRLQLRLGRTKDAFSTSERLRAQGYLALFDERALDPTNDRNSARELELRARVRMLQRSLLEEEAKVAPERRERAIASYSAELSAAEREYQTLLDDRGRSTPRFTVMSAPVTFETVRAWLGANEAVVEYVIDRDALFAFVLTRDALAVETLPLAERDLASKVELLRDLIQRPGNDDWRKPAASLAVTLLDPLVARGALADVTRLHIVPHGVLNYLPFDVLPVEGGALVDRFSLAYLPAAAALATRSSTASEARSMLVVAPARSRLRHARDEAGAVDALFRPHSRLLLDEAATESAFSMHAASYRHLHLATHGYFNKQNPLLSGLELEADAREDGLLEVHEIMGLSLDADLVTLSACQTGLGTGFFADVPAGDDFVGLTRAFLYAGSDAVLASLWEVDDRATGLLMDRFYRHLAASGEARDKAAALASAQRDVRAMRDLAHPYYWAAFVLVGNATTRHSPHSLLREMKS